MIRPQKISGLFAGLLAFSVVGAERVPVLIDTQIGSDIDHAFALGAALASPELDVRAITTIGPDAMERAWMVCRLLTETGKTNVLVAAGPVTPGTPIDWQIQYRRHPAVVWNRTAKPTKQTAADLLHAQLQKAPAILIATGPATTFGGLVSQHPADAARIQRIVLTDVGAAADPESVAALKNAGVKMQILSAKPWTLTTAELAAIFKADNALTFQLENLYELWDRPVPVLRAPQVVAACLPKPPEDWKPWLSGRLTGFGPAITPRAPANHAALIAAGRMPARVHVCEDYETDIEKRWWMCGKLETKNIAPESPGRRACRAVLTQDFDDRQGDTRAMYRAVIFNPVPGPPMGPHTRLSFRYWLRGTDTLRVQIFSLSNGYHRHLTVKGLPQERWQSAAVDMTQARRPDGSGGPLSADERIDDIQFYVGPRAELLIDDIVLYDAAEPAEERPFPRRAIFTGWFDTGKQGGEWPGDFKIVPHEKPRTWKAAQAVAHPQTGLPWQRVHLRGTQLLGANNELFFKYRSTVDASLLVKLVDSKTGKEHAARVRNLAVKEWDDVTIPYPLTIIPGRPAPQADEIHLQLEKPGELLIDDLLLYEPGK